MNRKSKVTAAASAMCVAGVIAGCGDSITAVRSWNAHVATSEYTEKMVTANGAAYSLQHAVRRGPLVDGADHPFSDGSAFSENCAAPLPPLYLPLPLPPGVPEPTCTVMVVTGGKVYVAQGTSGSLSGTFKALDRTGSTGTLTVRPIKTLPTTNGRNPVVHDQIIQITASPSRSRG